jgi:hypothetical protein
MSAKVIKYLIYIGIVLAFLAVPIGSYYIVRNANEKVSVLQKDNADLKTERDGYVARIEFDEKVKGLAQETDELYDPKFVEIEHFGKKLDDMIRLAPKTDSSKVLKDTVKMLKENAE